MGGVRGAGVWGWQVQKGGEIIGEVVYGEDHPDLYDHASELPL